MTMTKTAAINQARDEIYMCKSGYQWELHTHEDRGVHVSPSTDYFAAREQCRRARIERTLTLMGVADDYDAEIAVHMSVNNGSFATGLAEALRHAS